MIAAQLATLCLPSDSLGSTAAVVEAEKASARITGGIPGTGCCSAALGVSQSVRSAPNLPACPFPPSDSLARMLPSQTGKPPALCSMVID